MAKKKVTKKTTKKVDISARTLKKESLKTGKMLMYSAITLVVSIALFFASSNITFRGIFGLLAILSGALVLLGIIVELIIYFLKKKNSKK